MNDTTQESTIARTLSLGAHPPHRRHRLRWLIWSGAAAVIVAIALSWSSGDKAAQTQYRTEPVKQGGFTVTVTATGTLEPTNQVDVGSELSGIIRTVDVDYNDRVKVGQVLARLDTTKLEAQVLKSKASLASAQAKVLQTQATVKQSRSDLARLKEVARLSGGKVPSKSDIDTAEATLARALADEASAKASVSEAEATLDSDQTNLGKATIVSPINGIVLTRAVEPGQTVAASLQAPVLFVLAEDLSQMELHVDVDEADVGQVEVGQAATFTVDAYPNKTFPARITQVRYGAKTVAGVVTYETLLEVDNKDLSLRPGMTATADITVRRVQNAVLIPNAALRFAPPKAASGKPESGGSLLSKLFPRRHQRSSSRERAETGAGQQRVWILRDGRPVPMDVTAGATNGTVTEVLGGQVKPGMELVVEARQASA